MTRGVLLCVGPMYREVELFMARLKKENFIIETMSEGERARAWLRRNTVQAVLLSKGCPKQVAAGIIADSKSLKRNLGVPIILVGDAEVPVGLQKIKGVGEVMLLHRIPLAQAVSRLQLAIQLTQMTRQLVR